MRSDQFSLFEAQTLTALEKAEVHGRALAATLDEATYALSCAGRSELLHQVAKVIELHRLASARLGALIRKFGAGDGEFP